ncbi:hypothetical protein [Bacillus cereus group sp. MYBK87-2]|uniref:hypothetical protein n=1 Tax=unclassified Bacillus cereus group TaxID=2750818 RepID=UPI003F78D16B
MTWVQSIATLLGAIIGATITYVVNRRAFKNQVELERRKLEWNELQKNKQIKFEVYNELLEKNGVSDVIEFDRSEPLEIHKFNVSNYLKHIRLILFRKFHLLHSEVKGKVIQIDQELKRCEWNEEVDKDDNRKLLDLYTNILKIIEKDYAEMEVSLIENEELYK